MEVGFVKVAFIPVVATALSKHSPLLSSDRLENLLSPLNLQMTAYFLGGVFQAKAERERDGVKPSDEPTDREKSGECSCMGGRGGCEDTNSPREKKRKKEKKER